MDKILFSERLQQIRKERGFKSQEALAKAYNQKYNPNILNSSGILGSIKKWENPNVETLPTLDKIYNLCELLDCDLNYLTGKLPCSTQESSDFQKLTGLSEDTFESLKKLYENHQVIKSIDSSQITELDVLESIINQHNGNILNNMWGRLARRYPQKKFNANMVGVGSWLVDPDELRSSDDMKLYHALLQWIDEYNKIIDSYEF